MTRRSGSRPLPAVVPVLLVALLAGCGERHSRTETMGAVVGPIEEISSPAAPGSGEPHLAAGPHGLVMSWLEPDGETGHALRLAVRERGNWSEVRTVARGDDFFVNWADFPSVLPLDDGTLVAHWLVRGGKGTYDYGIRLSRSTDGGGSWSPPVVPHRDGTPQEHGFVSLLPEPGGGFSATWLDGRRYEYASDPAREEIREKEMTLRHTAIDSTGAPGPEVLLDPRVCDCCSTDAALTAEGPLVAYRDRSEAEVRDIAVVRRGPDGWSDPVRVHADGWKIAACPVNGPALAARGRRVAVAWFTAADEVAMVRVAFSDDAGRSFGEPVRVDAGDPAGRVDVVLLDEGRTLVSWLERTAGAAAEVRARVVDRSGTPGETIVVGRSGAGRASGFPRMARADGVLYWAWTDPEEPARIRVARAPIRSRPGETAGGKTP